MEFKKEIRWKQRFQNFNRAYNLLNCALEENDIDDLSNLEQEGVIQRFEYTYELAWKTLVEDSTVVVVPTPTPEEGLKPISGITINANENLSQFENYTFINENGEIATIKYDTIYYVINNKHSINKINWRIELPDGSKLIQGQGAGCRGNSYAFREGVKADVKFAADGYMYVIKDGSTVKYALNSK